MSHDFVESEYLSLRQYELQRLREDLQELCHTLSENNLEHGARINRAARYFYPDVGHDERIQEMRHLERRIISIKERILDYERNGAAEKSLAAQREKISPRDGGRDKRRAAFRR